MSRSIAIRKPKSDGPKSDEVFAKPFQAKIKGKIFQGILVRKDGQFFAYQNLCQHLPITLDLQDGQFLTHDRNFLQCHMHGAMYELNTGLCIAGPCEGARLKGLEIEEDEQQVVIKLPLEI